ncbi:MAG: chromate efflux transporter [Cyclobacteriaceae bacterium]|nr:chromate efflux transporter [Cyclobacteriaceae bacterium]
MVFKRVRNYIFLRDVIILALTAFGGPQAHIAMFMERLVKKRAYLSEENLIELYALCQILPGPTSTQTITAIGYKIGGSSLAFLTLLVWALPAVTLMTAAGMLISIMQENNISIAFTKFIQPMAVGFVSYATYKISSKVVNTNLGVVIMVICGVLSYFAGSPYLFPVILILAGTVTAFKYKRLEKEEKTEFSVNWSGFILWASVFLFAAFLGNFTPARHVLLFENFYRNGSLIFGGGQVLIPLLYGEFVDFKHFLSSEEFLTGYSFVQSIPGPTFSFSSYIGALSMRDYGSPGEILGGISAALGIFLPGTFLIFFVIRIWSSLKKYRVIKASLEGITAASSGMVAAAAVLLFQPLDANAFNIIIIIGTFSILTFTKVPAPIIILVGLIAGFIF